MPIVYALVARQKNVLAECKDYVSFEKRQCLVIYGVDFVDTSSKGNFPTVTRVLLSKIQPNDAKMSYSYDQYVVT